MTEDCLTKANEIKKEIENLEKVIGELKYRISCVKEPNQHPSNCNTATSIFYRLRAKFVNAKNCGGNEKARMIVFDNDHIYGTAIDVDEEFVEYIKLYFQNKVGIKKEEFKQL